MRKFCFLIIFIFIAVYSLNSFAQDSPALSQQELLSQLVESLYKKAVSAYNRGQLAEAEGLFMDILRVDPDHPGAELYLYEKIPDQIAREKIEESQAEAELKNIEAAARSNPSPKNIGALFKKGIYFYKNNDLEKAKEVLYKVLELSPDHRGAKIYLREKIPQKLDQAQLAQQEAEKLAEAQAEPEISLKPEQTAVEVLPQTKEAAPNQAVAVMAEERPKPVVSAEEPVSVPEESSSSSSQNHSEAMDYQYRIGSGDTLDISLYGEPDMRQVTRVSEEGIITYPFLGPIEVGGLTDQEVETKIEELLSQEYFVDPQISVAIKVNAKFNILGEVKRPGSYELSGPTSVIDAISIAGGFTDIASQNGVKVVRKNQDKNEVIKVPVRSILKTGDNSRNIYLQKGDTIVVPESFF